MISDIVYKIVYSIQRAYSDYCVKYRRNPNQLIMHKSIASILLSELGENEKTLVKKDGGFTFMGGVVIIIDDYDLFTDDQMFKWVSVSGLNI